MVTKTWPHYSSFLVGQPVFLLHGTQADVGSRIGALPLHKGGYYVLTVESDAVAPFTLCFTYSNKEKSKVLIDDPRFIGPDHPYESVIRAEYEDPAAQVTLGRNAKPPWPETIGFSRVSVSLLNPWFYFWRTVARDLSILALLAVGLQPLWRRYRQWLARVKVSTVLSGLIVVGAAMLVTRTWPHYSSFAVGQPVFVLHGTDAEPGSKIGALPLHKGKDYLFTVQSDAVAPFTLCFTYGDNEKSKILIDDPRVLGPDHPFESVIKAERDDPAAQVTLGRDRKPPYQGHISFNRVSISLLNPWLYFWRRVVRYVSILALLAASLHLFWRWSRQPKIERIQLPVAAGEVLTRSWRTELSSHPQISRWAAILLLIGIGFDGYYVGYEHSQLLNTPFRTSITGWDGSFYYFWLRSVMVDGDLDFRNDLLYCNSMPPSFRREMVAIMPRTKTGLIPNIYPIGWALLEVPWYMTADLTAQLINWCGGKVPYDGWGQVYQIFLISGQIVYATASLYFAWRILLEYLPPAFAACGLALGWLGAPLFFYQTVELIMTHNIIFFAITGVYFFTYRLRERPEELRYWFLVGLLSAFVILARYQGVIMLLFPGIVCLQQVGKDWRRLNSLLVAIVAGALPLALQMVAWKLLYGSFFLNTYGNSTFSWLHPHIYQVLFSPFHGLFNWHPMMLVGFLGFLLWAVRSRRYTEAICFTISLAFMTYVNAAWDCWWLGASFGARAFDTSTLFSMLGLGYLLSLAARRTVLFQAAVIALLLIALWNMNLVWMSQTGHLPFEIPVTWQDRIDMTWNYWSDPFA